MAPGVGEWPASCSGPTERLDGGQGSAGGPSSNVTPADGGYFNHGAFQHPKALAIGHDSVCYQDGAISRQKNSKCY